MIDDLRDPVFDISAWQGRDGALVIATARQGGVYISHDAGTTWSPAWNKGLAASIGVFTHDAGLSHILVGVTGGVLRSADDGEHWEYQSLGTPPPFVSSVAVVGSDAEWPIVIAGTLQDGLYRSCDGGATWNSCNTGVFIPRITALQSLGHRHAIAAAECCVFETRDGADRWNDIDIDNIEGSISAVGGNGELLLVGSDAGEVVAVDARRDEWCRIGRSPKDGEVLALKFIGDRDRNVIAAITSRGVRQYAVNAQGSTLQVIELESEPFQQPAVCGTFCMTGHDCFALTGHHDGAVRLLSAI